MQSSHVLLQASPPHSSASYRTLQEEQNDLNRSLEEQLVERDQFVSRLQAALRSEREKNARFQCRFNQQSSELKRREQQLNRMRERLSQFTERHRDRGLSIEIINTLSKASGRKETTSRSTKADARKEEALKLMLERREAELREAMKLRHNLTTLLHALRTNMQQMLDAVADEEEAKEADTSQLVQSEQSLGDHVTGGVVLQWTRVHQRLRELLEQSPVSVRTDQEKFLAQLEEELEQSRELVQMQQQLLQDSVAPLPDSLIDSYYLEEWERLQDKWAELDKQRRTFQQERQAFTDAAIRLGHERCEFEQQKASLFKQQFLAMFPLTKISCCDRRESTALSDLKVTAPDRLCLSSCITPSSDGSEVTPWSEPKLGMTPNTPELYCALQRPSFCREADSPPADRWMKETLREDLGSFRQNVDVWPF